MSPQGGLVADAKLQGHDRRHGQTREREVEDARAALRHVNVEARRHNRAVRNSPVHRYRDRAVRRPQERHLVAQIIYIYIYGFLVCPYARSPGLAARQNTPAIDGAFYRPYSTSYQLQPSFHPQSTEPEPTARAKQIMAKSCYCSVGC